MLWGGGKMDRLVYLFELDSVVKYEHKLQGVAFSKGIEALFSEIIVKGNSVALTMNQLADSQFMKEIIQNDKAYSTILQLFEYGALKVSLYNNIHTASQYMQQAIAKSLDKNDNFTFSSIPVKKEDKALLEKMGNGLKFSDLSLISDEIEKTQESLEAGFESDDVCCCVRHHLHADPSCHNQRNKNLLRPGGAYPRGRLLPGCAAV
jgi:hypothetical protein